jgi:hypothetical protein
VRVSSPLANDACPAGKAPLFVEPLEVEHFSSQQDMDKVYPDST